MAERERSRDRPGHSSSPSASGTGPFASILNLISSTRGGKGKPSVFSVVPTTSASASLEELVLPPHGIHSIPFDLDTAIRSMESSETSKAELCEVVKATTIYIARREDVFAPQMKPQVPAAEVRTLYIRASALVKVDSDKALRDAAMGLLTALTVVFPPSASAGVDDELISIRSLYSLIISSTASSISADSIVSQVTALKGLTKDGTEVTGMDGIVGWLIRSLSGMSEQWTAWCGLRGGAAELRGSIDPVSPADSTIAIIDLLIKIVANHHPLFSPADLTRVVVPILEYFWSGITASSTPTDEQPSPVPTETGRGSPVSGPSPTLRRSVMSSGSRKDTSSYLGTPTPQSGIASPPSTVSSISRSLLPEKEPVLDPKWTRALPAFCTFVEMLVRVAALSDDLFEHIVTFLCFCFGQDDVDRMPISGWEVTQTLLKAILGPEGGRRGELIVRNVLEGKGVKGSRAKLPEADRKVTRGAVIAARTWSLSFGIGTPLTVLLPSLRAAQSTARILGDGRKAERQQWHPVDDEILSLLSERLLLLESASSGESGAIDTWTEGEAACELLRGMIPVIMRIRDLPASDAALAPNFFAALHQLPSAISSQRPSTSSSPASHHSKYIDLLIELAPCLDEDDAAIAIDYYRRECLCLPSTTHWIKNIWKLLQTFYISTSHLDSARRQLCRLLYKDVYSYAEIYPEHRTELVDRVIVPFLDRVLLDEKDEDLFNEALAVLVSAGVAETKEKDQDHRRGRASRTRRELDEEDITACPGEELIMVATGGSFSAIRAILMKIATQTSCIDDASSELARSASVRTTSKSRDAGAALRGLTSPRSKEMDIFSPPNTLADEPHFPASAAPFHPGHTQCKSIRAVTSLIGVFSGLSFAPPDSLLVSKAARTPVSLRSIIIYRDLLGLLYPMTDDLPHSTLPPSMIPARCPKARIVILQWLTRLRADSQHRIYLKADIDGPVSTFAAILKRTRESKAEAQGDTDDAKRRGGRASRGEPSDERGRASRSKEKTNRSRSRSRQAAVLKGVDRSHNPLWRVPDILNFEVPWDNQPSESLMTYDADHPLLGGRDAPLVEGVWLPVSEYVRVLNGILRGHDWEMASYVLCFLPLQLGNKLFFHGGRATREVRALLDVLCMSVLGSGTGPAWEKRFNHPTYIRKIDINAAAYQSLSILISYRGVFTSAECERMVQAFMAGLQGKSEVAKPCLQALTLSIFELPTPVGRHLTSIIDSMKNILSTTGLAVHILEFLIALGQNGSLFRNFTEDQYRLVFVVAINYIAEHNARSDQTVDLTVPTSRESFTLSQHVIGLAYYAIYIWFMQLKMHQRPNLVPEITRELLKGRSQRVLVDEMAEVCFDWLARYTYGNADPKPATSFLSEMVMQDGAEGEPAKTQSWLLGGSIITVTSHARTGWATITTTRPTGSTSVVCKLENVPLLELGEANADLMSLPAFLMANRPVSQDAETQERSPDGDPRAVVSAQSGVSSSENFDPSSQHGYIWSGATPSQRRKDVVIEPSYIALQLLSSYPVASLEVPRGRLIPKEEKFTRTLSLMQTTPVIDQLKVGVLYVGPGQTKEVDIFGNIDGSPLYLEFLSGVGRLVRLKGQMDVYLAGLDRDNDEDGEYAYAWWDDLSQMTFHTATMMPNLPESPKHDNKKRLVANDYVKIVYNDSGRDFVFDTIKTNFNLINIVISPHTTGAGNYEIPTEEGWSDWDREDWFKVTLQRAPGIPDFSPIGTHKLVSRRSLPIVVRQIAHLANDMAARSTHISMASDPAEAEYITSWRERLRMMGRLRDNLPPIALPDPSDLAAKEHLIRDFTRTFSYPPPSEKD